MVLRQDHCLLCGLRRPLVCTCSINYTVLASGHWRTTPQAGDLFIDEILRFAVVERENILGFPFPERLLHKHYDWGRSNSSCEGEM